MEPNSATKTKKEALAKQAADEVAWEAEATVQEQSKLEANMRNIFGGEGLRRMARGHTLAKSDVTLQASKAVRSDQACLRPAGCQPLRTGDEARSFASIAIRFPAVTRQAAVRRWNLL